MNEHRNGTFGGVVAAGVLVLIIVLALLNRLSAQPKSPGTVLQGYPSYAATVVTPSVDVHTAPSGSSAVHAHLPRRNENGAPQTFLVEGSAGDTSGHTWYRVMLPIKPNGSSGWVPATAVRVTGIHDALVVYLRSFRLDLLVDKRVVRRFAIGVGKDNTPTPSGVYYIKELIRPPNQNTIYGHYVLGLNGFSNVLVHWPDGGVIGIHGTNDMRSIGRQVSHGCIRMSNADITYLAHLLPLGTPVSVRND